MAYRLLHKKSCVSGKTPTAAQLEYGELAINFNPNSPKLYFKDSGDTIVSFIDEKKINNLLSSEINTLNNNLSTDINNLDGKLTSSITNLNSDLSAQTNTLETAISNLDGKLTSSITNLSAQITNLNSDLTTQTNALGTEISNLDDKLTSDITKLSAQTNTLGTEISNLSAQTIVLETTVSEQTESIKKKQDQLVSGTNIKTINGNPILGNGNITIDNVKYNQGEGIIIDNNNTIKINTDIVALNDKFDVGQLSDCVHLRCDGTLKIQAATTEKAGVMSSTDKTNLDNLVGQFIDVPFNVGQLSDCVQLRCDGSLTILGATTEEAGVMTAEDKKNLNKGIDSTSFRFSSSTSGFNLNFATINGDNNAISFPIATSGTAGVMSSTDKKNLDYLVEEIDNIINNGISGDTSASTSNEIIEWDSSLNLNDYIEDGTYIIKGIRKSNQNDNLPFNNVGDNASFVAKLIVMVSPQGNTMYRHIVGQTLILANAEGHETKIYTRSGNKTSYDDGLSYPIEWGAWSTMQNNREVGLVENLDDFIDNGIYSGVWNKDGEYFTFVCVVINDYALNAKPRRVSQFVYGLSKKEKKTIYQTRIGEENDEKTITWDNDWKIINYNEIIDLISKPNFTILQDSNYITLDFDLGCDGNLIIPAATSGTAGVMSSTDKIHLDYLYEHFDDNTFNIAQLNDYVQLRCDGGSIISAATDTYAGVMTAEDKKNLDYLVEQFDDITSTSNEIIEWDSSSNLNDFINAGVYNIKGTRQNTEDNLPITNSGENATIAARLIVTVTPQGATTYRHSVGQTLILSNAEGKETKIYTRNGNRTSYDGEVSYTIEWSAWATQQTNINVGLVDNLDNLKDNGIYSGVWYPLTFVCVVINDYFLGEMPRRISQFVYGLSKIDGSVVYQSRVWSDDENKWGDWEVINKNQIYQMIGDEIRPVNDTITTITENLVAMINAEAESRNNSDVDIKSKAVHYSLYAMPSSDKVNIGGKSVDGNNTISIDIPAATSGTAGVMTADDKAMLDYLVEEINDIINNGIGTSGMTSALTNTNFTIEQNSNNQIIFKFDDGKKQFISAATSGTAGVMSSTDKTNLDKINDWYGANKTAIKEISGLTVTNASDINAEIQNRKSDDASIKAEALQSIVFSPTKNTITVDGRTINGTITLEEVISAATETQAGVMSATDKIKINKITNLESSITAHTEALTIINDNAIGNSVNFSASTNDLKFTYKNIIGSTSGYATIPLATSGTAGVMSSEDKKKLNNLKNINLTVDGTTLIIE